MRSIINFFTIENLKFTFTMLKFLLLNFNERRNINLLSSYDIGSYRKYYVPLSQLNSDFKDHFFYMDDNFKPLVVEIDSEEFKKNNVRYENSNLNPVEEVEKYFKFKNKELSSIEPSLVFWAKYKVISQNWLYSPYTVNRAKRINDMDLLHLNY